MKSALSIAAVALLATSLLAMAIVAASPAHEVSDADYGSDIDASTVQQEPDDETTTRLGLDGPTEHEYVEPPPDLGAALTIKDDELRTEWSVYEVEYHWETLSNSEREELLERLEDRLLERIDELESRERRAAGAFYDGDASAQELLRTQARNDREAKALAGKFQRLSDLADEVPDYSIATRSTLIALENHQGPLREQTFEALSASEEVDLSSGLLVEAGRSGVVVSAIEGRTYIREANRFDHRDPSAPNQLDDFSAVNERLDEYYPWALHSGLGDFHSLNQYRSIQQFRLELNHQQGLLLAYVDGGTTDVFREVQELRIDDLPKDSVGTWENDSVELSINGTPRNGPIEVTAIDAETGDPVDGEVSIGDTAVARTGSEGSVWILPPPGQFELTVETDDGSVTADGLG